MASALRLAPGSQSASRSAPASAFQSALASALRSAPGARSALWSVLTLGLSSGAVSPSDAADALLAAVAASNWLTAVRSVEHESPSAVASPLVIGAQALQSAPGRCLRLAQSGQVLAMDEADDWLAAVLR